MQPALKAELFALLEAKILAGKQGTGRTGMDLWQILVLGVVRLGLDADWDRMEDLANHHVLVRQMLGVPLTPWGEDAKVFGHQTLRDNVALLHVCLRQRLRAVAGGLTPRAVLEKFCAVQMVDVHLPTTDGREVILTRHTQPEKELQVLLEQLKLTLPAQPPPKITAAALAL